MATAAPAFEDYSIVLRSGDAQISRLVLSGWQTAASTLATWSDKGRMWGKITTGDVFELYRRPGLASGDKVCNGTISSNAVTLSQANSSGISGSADINTFTSGSTHLFDVIVSYADEQDIVRMYSGAANELDSNSKYEGQDTRFEALLKEQKRYLDQLLWTRLKDQIGTDTLGRPLLGYIADPRQLARVHAKLCVAQLYERRGDVGSEAGLAFHEAAARARSQAVEELNSLNILLDSNRDQVADSFGKPGVIPVGRA